VNSALEQIWKRADLRGHVISYDETRRWPAAEREAIFRLGILRQIEDAEVIACDACADPHEEEIFFLGTDTQPRIWCPEVGLVRVPVERLRRWEVDFDSAARLLARALELIGKVQVLTPGRIRLLGRRRVADRTAEFFLVQGIAWPDSVELLRAAPRLQNSPAPIILCPDRLPKDPEWQQNGRALFPLTEVARLEDSRLVIPLEGFEDLHRQIAVWAEEPPLPTPVEQRPQLIEDFRRKSNCLVKNICSWANVKRQDLSKWKLGQVHLLPDRSEKAIRIERLLQRGHKTRT
jgi:hypothetical protein